MQETNNSSSSSSLNTPLNDWNNSSPSVSSNEQHSLPIESASEPHNFSDFQQYRNHDTNTVTNMNANGREVSVNDHEIIDVNLMEMQDGVQVVVDDNDSERYCIGRKVKQWILVVLGVLVLLLLLRWFIAKYNDDDVFYWGFGRFGVA